MFHYQLPCETWPCETDQYYSILEHLWSVHASNDEIDIDNAMNFLFEMMYSKRLIEIIPTERQIVQVARHLVRYLKKASQCTIKLHPFEKEE